MSGKELDACDQVRVTSQLFDLLSDNSSVDHPLCGECTDSLLQVVEAPDLVKPPAHFCASTHILPCAHLSLVGMHCAHVGPL